MAAFTDDQCTMAAASTLVPAGETAQSASAAAVGSVVPFWNYVAFYIGPWSVYQWHVNVGIVWTSSTAYTKDWGVDCYLTTVPGYFGGYDGGGWCGVYNPRLAWTAQPGSNFYIAPILIPIQRRWAWMRYYAHSDGTMSAVSGGWS